MQPQSNSILDEGALSAIKSAKTALKMDDEEKDRALGMGLVKLFAGMAKPGYGDGLNGALSALTQNMPSAVDAYTGEEGRAQNMNAALLNHISQMRAKQQEAWMNAVDKSEARKDRRDNLQMKRDHYAHMEKKSDALLALKQAKLKKDMPESVTLGGKEYSPIASKQEHRLFVNDKKNFGHILKELQSIQKDYGTFRQMTKDNLIDPQAPYYAGTLANESKDLWGAISGNLKQKQETAKRKGLEAKLNKFAVELERKLKGGVLSEGMIKRFEKKGILPSLDDRPEVFDQKLSDLMKEISVYEKAASDSLRTGLVITPLDIEETEEAGGGNGVSPELDNLSTEDLERELAALKGQ